MPSVKGKKSDDVCKIDGIIFKVLLVGLLIIPLVTRTALVKVYGPLIQSSMIVNATTIDFFDYYKFMFLMILTVVIVALFIAKLLINRERLIVDKTTIILVSLYITVLISLILADYKSLAIFGHMYEGSVSYLFYLLIFFACINIKYDLDKLKFILYPLAIVLIINAGIGLLNYYGVNILQYPIIKSLLVADYAGIEVGAMNSTFSNQNYASGVSAILFMIFFVVTLLDESKRRWGYLLITCLSFAFLLSALSASGFLTIILLIPVALILIYRITPIKRTVVPILLLVIICSGIYYPMVKHNHRLHNETFGYIFQAIQKITWTTGVVYAAESTPLGYDKIKSTNINDALQEVFGLVKSAPSAGRGRLYIWAETWELVKARPLFGYGMGTLGHYFDNNDPKRAGAIDTIVTKPHNYYLGLAFGTGLIGLLLFLALVFIYLIDILRKFIINNVQIHPIQISLFMGILAYLVQVLVNDSVIGMSIIFWIVFGISVGLLKQYNLYKAEV